MATTFNIDLLRGVCLAHKLSPDGTHDEMVARLGAHLVSQLLNPSAAAHVDKKKRPPTSAGAAGATPKRPMSAWYHFLRTEKELVKAAGFHGRVAILKECARRWALVKRVNTSEAPLMLMASEEATSEASSSSETASETESVPDGLMEAIKELPCEEIHASLAAHAFPIDPDHEVNVATLARAMMG